MTEQEFFKRYSFKVATDKIGGGSFGTVYKAFDDALDRYVAIKVSEVKEIGGKEFSLRIEFEAIKNMAPHRNIANYEQVYRFQERSGTYDYAIMQFYPLGNLSHYLDKNPIDLAKKETILKGILDGIGHLHKHKVVHRDLKPSNILLVDRNGNLIPKITDFGLSKQANSGDNNERFTNSFAGGTLQYSSPEQLKGEPLKLNTDLWSFGAIAFEILTDSTLFVANSVGTASAEWQNEITQNILHQDISAKLNTLPGHWQKAISACMERDLNKRVQNVAAILALLGGEAPIQQTQQDETPIVVKPKKPPVQKADPDAPTIIKGQEPEVGSRKSEAKRQKVEVGRQKSKGKSPKAKAKWPLPFALLGIALIISAYFLWPTESPETKAWQNAKQENKIELFNNYLKNYPNGVYITQAKAFIKTLEETEKLSIINKADSLAWQKAEKENTVKFYNIYIDSFPSGNNITKAKDILAKLAIPAWQKAKKKNTVRALRNFKKQFPKSVYNSNANTLLKTLSWDKTFGGKLADYLNSAIQTKDGGYMVAGRTTSKGAGSSDFWLIKVNNKGIKQWDKTFGGKLNEYAQSIIQTTDGGYMVAGYTQSKGAGGYDFWLIKLDKEGNL